MLLQQIVENILHADELYIRGEYNRVMGIYWPILSSEIMTLLIFVNVEAYK